MNQISNNKKKGFARFFLLLMIMECLIPLQSLALTGGPTTPEVQSFTPIGVSEMVDVASGSFSYNIPLFEIGGYPVNLAYSSGITMDQEASTAGLGWNINVGAINRTMRGLPDDFNGDFVQKRFHVKPEKTWGGQSGANVELFGIDGLNLGVSTGAFYNTKRGVGVELGVTPSFSASLSSSSSLTTSLGLSANSQEGIGFSPSVSYEGNTKILDKASLGFNINSRQGLKTMTIGLSLTNNPLESRFSRESATYSFVNPTYIPNIEFPMKNTSITVSVTGGGEVFGSHISGNVVGYFTKQELATDLLQIPSYGTMYAEKGADKKKALMDFNRENDIPFSKYVPHLPVPIMTNDIYSVNGQGVGGSYQLKRSDIGVLFDNQMNSFGAGESFGGEVGFGNLAHGGADVVFNSNTTKSQKWDDLTSNPVFKKLNFWNGPSNPLYEKAYFKMAGEKSIVDQSFLQRYRWIKSS